MALDVATIIRTAKRLQEATGYLELGMPQHALDCLEGLNDSGPLEAEVASLRSKALGLQHGHDQATLPVQHEVSKPASAAKTKTVWLTLSLCYQLAGNAHQAIQALAHARGAEPTVAQEPGWPEEKHPWDE